MLLIIFLICLGIFIASFVWVLKSQYPEDNVGGITISIFSALATVALFITLIVGVTKISTGTKYEQQIAMYEEENVRIESTVTGAVERYLEEQGKIFESLGDGEDVTTLVAVYPEITGNELVMKQIELFVENNNKIKDLKESKLSLITWKFLVYFGK